MGLLSKRANAYAVLLNIAKFPSVRVVPFCIPTSTVSDRLLLPGLASRIYSHAFRFSAD